jgi:hypothetical protein
MEKERARERGVQRLSTLHYYEQVLRVLCALRACVNFRNRPLDLAYRLKIAKICTQ